MNVKLTELEIKLLIQALKIWHGDFPSSGCEPSVIWEKELQELIEKLDPYLT